MHKIEFGAKIVREYPESIGEMTSEQYLEFIRLMILYRTNALNYTEFSLRLSYILLDLKRRIDINTHEDTERIAENLKQIMKLNEAFFEEQIDKEGNRTKVIKTDFLSNPLPIINGYIGPSEALTNTCFGEYVSALNAYVDYGATGEEQSLNWVLGSLYRPICKKRQKQKFEDIREPYDKNKVAHYADVFSKLPFETRYGVYLWFASCQKFIVTNEELELSGGTTVDLSSLFKNSGGSDDKGIGMVGIIFDLAESNVFGNADDVENQSTYSILVRMVQTKLHAEKLRKNAKNN